MKAITTLPISMLRWRLPLQCERWTEWLLTSAVTHAYRR